MGLDYEKTKKFLLERMTELMRRGLSGRQLLASPPCSFFQFRNDSWLSEPTDAVKCVSTEKREIEARKQWVSELRKMVVPEEDRGEDRLDI